MELWRNIPTFVDMEGPCFPWSSHWYCFLDKEEEAKASVMKAISGAPLEVRSIALQEGK